MKILFANPALGYGGGIATYATELIKCLSQEHELTVVLPDDKKRPIKEPGVKVLYYDTQELSKKNALIFIKLINEELKPDLVISSQGLIVPVIVPYLNNDIRVMTVSHSGRLFTSEYSAVNHQYTDDIIAASSDYNKRFLEKKYHIKDKSRVKVVYNFMSSAPELEALREVKKKSDVIQIIYSGGPLPGKSPDLVLDVLYRLLKTNLNFKFYWTGGTELPLPQKIAKWFKPNDVRQFLQEDERVVFTGFVSSKEELDRLIASSNILLTPSRNEGCSMLLLEALRSGSICMVADYPHGNREIVERGNCGFVLSHRHPEEFARQLEDIISNPSNYTELYENAYQAYKQKFTYPVWKESMNAVLNTASTHKTRKKNVSNARIVVDVLRMKAMQKSSHYKRLFGFAVKSLCFYYILFFKMRLKGDFPLKSMYVPMH